MRTLLLALAILACAAWAANLKLYMKDGSYHIVREYQVQPDRVHFYSVERSGWEDVPLDLVDLKRTESEAAERQAKLEEDTKVMAQEEKAERDLEKEKTRIPQDPGAYWLLGNEVQVMKLAEGKAGARRVCGGGVHRKQTEHPGLGFRHQGQVKASTLLEYDRGEHGREHVWKATATPPRRRVTCKT